MAGRCLSKVLTPSRKIVCEICPFFFFLFLFFPYLCGGGDSNQEEHLRAFSALGKISTKLAKQEATMKLSYVVFSHGKESGPMGSKIQRLMAEAKRLGLHTISVDYRKCATASERVAFLDATLRQLDTPPQQVVLVGSSMGGYVSTVMANSLPVAGLFLMAPALWMPSEEYTVQSYQPLTSKVEITHGINDDVVPCENSIRFAREHEGTILHLVPDDHRLKASLDFLACQFRRFVEELTL